jgi:threonine/homoserine/homoserine lactone efflux protein
MLDPASLVVYAFALFVAAATPGPGIAAIVARVLGKGPKGAIAFSMGVGIGDIVWLSFAVGGLALLAQTFSALFLAIKYLGAAYLLFLAWKLWTAPVLHGPGTGEQRAEPALKLFLGGLSLTLGNPKVMIFYTALLPNLVDVSHLGVTSFTELSVATLAVLTVVFSGYIILAARARHLFTSPRALTLINRGSGTVMAGAAVAIATR